MTDPTATTSSMTGKDCKTNRDASTPPDRYSSLPLTPPPTDDRRVRAELPLNNAVAILEDCHDRPHPGGPAPQISLTPLQYERLLSILRENPDLKDIDNQQR